jgi:hypothetical protein
VTYLYNEDGSGTHALVEDDEEIKFLKHGTWVDSKRIKVGVPVIAPVLEDEWEEDQLPIEDDVEENP